MNENIICNFSVLRFMPYPETEEFVNIGIVLSCPQLGTFMYKIETHRRERVTNFFPELDVDLFIEGRHSIEHELKRLTAGLNRGLSTPPQPHFHFKEESFRQLFKEIVKPRESLFRFGDIGTVITLNEKKALKELFAYYVERQFAVHEEYHETVMKKRIACVFKAKDLLKNYHEKKFGNDQYHVNIPFVYERNNCALQAIKPIDLNKEDTTRIIEYGDRWRMRIQRLRDMKDFPVKMLFVVRQARSGIRHDIALEIRESLSKLDTFSVSEHEDDKIIDFAGKCE